MSTTDLTANKFNLDNPALAPRFSAYRRSEPGHKGHYGQARLWLASQSPRRLELLGGLGLQFEVKPSHIDETTTCSEPAQVVQDLSVAKAEAIAATLSSPRTKPALILGSDTIVVLAGEIIGKPADHADAVAMLTKLSGHCHQVYTGIALVGLPCGDTSARDIWYGYAVSNVWFRKLDATEIKCYVQTGEPLDKAGAYALQGTASSFVERIDGCYTNVIGLSIPLTVDLLRQAGYQVLGLPAA